VLDTSAFSAKTGMILPHWNDALNAYIASMPAGGGTAQ
jgi:dTDP-4-dehydrorhamnose reductase